MGFGILFYGVLMLIELSVRTSADYAVGIDLFPDLAGYLLMLTAAYRLSDYGKGFQRLRIALYPLVALGAVTYLAGILSGFGVAHGAVFTVVRVCHYLTNLLLPVALFFLFAGIVSLAFSVELPRIAGQARFLAVFTVVYFASQLLLTLTGDLTHLLPNGWENSLTFILNVVFLVYVIFTEVCLFKCYMYICYEGEETITRQDTANPLMQLFKKHKDK